ncbi:MULTISPECIES: hypothetical protein [unclassified Streptomyces]|uniref:hypothetical protein n=1 Tax=unclassified Streptomyces TaxID=2593676 RepID=UPI001F5B9FFC|nr:MULTISPECIES: hypothetical protein [unclassified Streptomyces]
MGHSSMSAHRLPAVALLGAFAATAAAAWTAAGRRRGAPTVAGAMAVLQGALHLLFSTAGSRAGDTGHPMTDPAMGAANAVDGMPHPGGMHGGLHGTHAMSAMSPATDMGSGTDMGSTMAMLSGGGLGMLAVHLLAALVCGLWLARGEAAFLTLAEAALAYAFTPLRPLLARVPVPHLPRPALRRARRSAHRPHTVVLAHALSRRGPPRLPAPRATALGAHV